MKVELLVVKEEKEEMISARVIVVMTAEVVAAEVEIEEAAAEVEEEIRKATSYER